MQCLCLPGRLSVDEAQAIDYLVKPVRQECLAAAAQRVRTFAAGMAQHAGEDGGEGQRRTHLRARLRGSLRLIPIEESLKSLETEFGERFVRIHRNCLVARHEIVELRRIGDGHTQAVLRHGEQPLEVSRRCVAQLRETLRHL